MSLKVKAKTEKEKKVKTKTENNNLRLFGFAKTNTMRILNKNITINIGIANLLMFSLPRENNIRGVIKDADAEKIKIFSIDLVRLIIYIHILHNKILFNNG